MPGFLRASMAINDTFRQRFEAKYRVTELQAHAIRSYIAPFVFPDRLGGPDGAYPVNSMYLDSLDRKLYRGSIQGEKNRVKLRIRSYTQSPSDHTFVEIKRRTDQIISKQRGIVPKPLLTAFLCGESGELPDTSPLVNDPIALQNFLRLMSAYNAKPCAMVRYDREAYVGRSGNGVRITFDRRLTALSCPEYHPDIWRFDDRWTAVNGVGTILEIKFNYAFPEWVHDLVERFSLQRESVSKYVLCLMALKRQGRIRL